MTRLTLRILRRIGRTLLWGLDRARRGRGE